MIDALTTNADSTFVDVTGNTLTTTSTQLQPNPSLMMKAIASVNFITHAVATLVEEGISR